MKQGKMMKQDQEAEFHAISAVSYTIDTDKLNIFRSPAKIQELLAQLQAKGWTIAAIADELGMARHSVAGWKSGKHQPANYRVVDVALQRLSNRRRVPKRRRYGLDALQRRPRRGPAES